MTGFRWYFYLKKALSLVLFSHRSVIVGVVDETGRDQQDEICPIHPHGPSAGIGAIIQDTC